MRYAVYGTLLALLWGTITQECFAQSYPPIVPGASYDGVATLNEGNDLIPMVDLSFHHFRGACEHCREKHPRTAAAEIRKAVAHMKRETHRATNRGKEALGHSIRELGRLARRLDSGGTASIAALEGAFARAHRALALHHHEMASESWLRRKAVKTGHHLKAAARHVEYGISWAGEGIESGSLKTLHATRDLSGKLIGGASWGVNEVGNGAKALAKEIQRLGKLIQPARR